MSTRERMTWGGKSAAGPTLPSEAAAKRRASAHPQTPDEGITHPAGYDDPKQPAAYENGDTSAWAEDPSTKPVRTSPAPANPVDDGGYRHPAAQPGAPAKNASHDVRAAVERKASKCIKIASALLGPQVAKAAEMEDKVAVDMIEAQALDFMDLPDARIASTLRRIEAATADPEVLLRKMLAEEEGKDPEADEEEEVEDEGEKKEAAAKRAEDTKLAEITSMLASLQKEMASIKAGWGAKAEEPAAPEVKVSEEDAMLAEMLKEEEAEAAKAAEAPAPEADAEAEAMLQAMLAEEAAPAAEPEAPAAAGKSLADYLDDDMGDMSMDVLDDPMGVLDDPGMGGFGDDKVLASLFASKTAEEEVEEEKSEDEGEKKEAKKAEESEEESESDEEAAKKANRTASVVSKLRPQPKKASVGAKTVGTQTRVASNVGDVSDLAKLWDSAPDVSRVFGS